MLHAQRLIEHIDQDRRSLLSRLERSNASHAHLQDTIKRHSDTYTGSVSADDTVVLNVGGVEVCCVRSVLTCVK
eukprot:23497-Eustigmatos_ZCMA.PRE.1